MKEISSPVTVTSTTYACERCGITSTSRSQMEQHEERHRYDEISPSLKATKIGSDEYVLFLGKRENLKLWAEFTAEIRSYDRIEMYWRAPGWYVAQLRQDYCSCGCGATKENLHCYTVESVREDLHEEMCNLAKRYRTLGDFLKKTS